MEMMNNYKLRSIYIPYLLYSLLCVHTLFLHGFLGTAPHLQLSVQSRLALLHVHFPFLWQVDVHLQYFLYTVQLSKQTTSTRVSVDTLCRDSAGQISHEQVQRGRLTHQETTS